MTNTTSPQGKENNVPWRIAFGRKDLLAAAWGSKKGADLLYHFIHRASWEAKNQKLADDLNDIKVQSSLPKALESASISRGCYHTYLKLFVEVGYVSMEPYGKDLTVHLAAIKSAFTSTPEKPTNEKDKPKQPRTKRYKLNDCTFVSLPAEEFEKMQEERFKMNEMVQSLNDSVAKLNLLVQSLNQNPSIYSTPEARLRAIFDSRYALEYRDDSDFFGEQVNETDQDQKPALPEKNIPDLDVLCEDMGLVPFNSANHSYSQDIPTSTTDSSRLQENKAHQSIDILTSQETVPAQKSAAPKLPNMTRDVLQRENRPPTVAEQKRIDEREQREKAQQVTRRKAELWTLFDGLFGSRVDRAGYNKSHVEGLALNPLATDPIIKQAFESVAKSAADKKDPTKLTITNVANVVPAYIRTEQIKVVQSKQPKQETELERMKREQREAMAKRALQEVAQ